MRHQHFSVLVLALLGAALVSAAHSTPVDQTTTRPISDFISTQGTWCNPFGPPFRDGCAYEFIDYTPILNNVIGFSSTNAVNRLAFVDYAGLANDWIVSQGSTCPSGSMGTTMEGTITERPLKDGRAEVDVQLHTKNALTYAFSGDGNGNYTDWEGQTSLLFGHAPREVCAGADAALGDSYLGLKFINTAPGARLPDFVQLAYSPDPGQELREVIFQSESSGTLRANFGVADGTPGRCMVSETGLFMSGFHGKVGVNGGFPAEVVDLEVTGK